MSIENFKKLYNEYKVSPNLDNENILLRSLAFDVTCYTLFVQYEDGIELKITQNEQMERILNVYTDVGDIQAYDVNKFKIMKADFEELLHFVNIFNIDCVVVNLNNDGFVLTASQLSKIYRDKYYAKYSYPITLRDNNEFKKIAINVKNVEHKHLGDRLIDTYVASVNSTDDGEKEKLFNEFIEEFVGNAVFYTEVSPTGMRDENGNLVVGKDRVFYTKNDGEKGPYNLMLDISWLASEENASEEIFVTAFKFSDYIKLMDAAHGKINGLKITGKTTTTINLPADYIYRYNAIKEHNDLLKDATIINGLYAPSEEINNIEKELENYFKTQEIVEKVWLAREIEMYKNGKTAYVYSVVLKVAENKMDESATAYSVRRILGNRLFKIYNISYELNDRNFKLVYEK